MADRSDKYWLVAVPCDGTGERGVKKTMRRLTECIHVKGRRLAGECVAPPRAFWVARFTCAASHSHVRLTRAALADISYFPIPALKVGTLDALMVRRAWEE